MTEQIVQIEHRAEMGQPAATTDVTSVACHLLKFQRPQQEAMTTPLVWVSSLRHFKAN